MMRLMIRKPKMYERMSEASFSPGVWATLLIAMALYLTYFLVREIPAFLIDLIHYSGQTVRTDADAERVILEYITSPGTMLVALALTLIFLVITIVYICKIEKRPISTIGILRPAAGKFTSGYLLGFALFAAAVAPQFIYGQTEFRGFSPFTVAFLIAYVVQACSEEVFFRGFLLSSLSVNISVIAAVLLSSVLFSLLNAMNQGASVLRATEAFTRGAMLAFFTLRTGSLWGAIGMHAALSFVIGLVSPIAFGSLLTNYAALSITGSSGFDMPLFIAFEIIASGVIIFVGRNRLAVSMSDEMFMYKTAARIARSALKRLRGDDGVPLVERAFAIARSVEAYEVKTAALLHEAYAGSGADAIKLENMGFSNRVAQAVEALSPSRGPVAGIVKNPIAAEIRAAALRSGAELKVKYHKHAKKKRGSVYCTLLRREIDDAHCMQTQRSLDGSATYEGFFANVNVELCKTCKRRSTSRQT